MEVIRDPYTGAAHGQVALTAIMLWNFKILRETGFGLFQIQEGVAMKSGGITERRAFEFRASGDSVLEGVVVPYDTEARIGAFRESFSPGAFQPIGSAIYGQCSPR